MLSKYTCTKRKNLAMRIALPFFMLLAIFGGPNCTAEEDVGTWDETRQTLQEFAQLAANPEFLGGVKDGFYQAGTELVADLETVAHLAHKGINKAGEGLKKAAEAMPEDVDAAKKALTDGASRLFKWGSEVVEDVQRLDGEDFKKVVEQIDEAATAAAEAAKQFKADFFAKRDKYLKSFEDNLPRLAEILANADFAEVIILLQIGDWELLGLGDIPDEVQEGILEAIGFLDFAWEHVRNADPRVKGFVVGYVAFQFIPFGKVVKATKILEPKRKAVLLEKGIPDSVFTKWDELQQASKTWCFDPQTPIWTPQGLRPIGEVVPGDYVLSADEVTGRKGYIRVVEVMRSIPERPVSVMIVGAYGVGVDRISASDGHPFYSKSDRAFLQIRKFSPGQELSSIHSPSVRVGEVCTEESVDAYVNLALESLCTYYVGESGIWVHNKAPNCQRFYKIARIISLRGIRKADGTVLDVSARAGKGEWDAMQHIFQVISKKRGREFDHAFVKSLHTILASRHGRNGKFTPSYIAQYGMANKPPVADGMVWNHFWRREWMVNPQANYNKSPAFVCAQQLHLSGGVGVDWLFEDWMTKRVLTKYMPIAQQRRYLNAAGELTDKKGGIMAAQTHFKTRLTADQRLSEVRTFWDEMYAIEIPSGMSDDGVLRAARNVADTLAGTP